MTNRASSFPAATADGVGIMTAPSRSQRDTVMQRLGIRKRPPVKALLLDMDDTLLLNDWDTFSSHYYRLLTDHVAHLTTRDAFMTALYSGTRAMVANDGSGPSNQDLFLRRFLPHFPECRDEMLSALDQFYGEVFDDLRVWTGQDPAARQMVEAARRHDLQIAIATQPVFPLSAILARLRWAGVSHEQHQFDYVACYEEARACKPHPHYFLTICQHLRRAPEECLMVGDSIDADLPAAECGLRTFWVERHPPADGARIRCDARGLLPDLIALIETGAIHDL